MAVFTPVTEEEAAGLIAEWPAGELLALKPIAAGVENTNYFVTTGKGEWVLTVFEKLNDRTLPFYISFMEHLGKKGCAVAQPLRTKHGDLFIHFKGKPAILTNRLSGEDGAEVNACGCASMGRILAKMHLASEDFPLVQELPRGLSEWIANIPAILPHIPDELRSDLANELQAQIALQGGNAWKALPAGAVHADLFRNNAKVVNAGTENEAVTGVFDFFFAGTAPFLYDLAVTMNDWCTDLNTGAFVPEKAQAFISAYSSVRPLSHQEKMLWRGALCAAAFRFWVSRLTDYYMPREASLLTPHDPEPMHRVLRNRRTADLPWPEC